MYLSDSRVLASVVCSRPSSRDLSRESWKGYSGPMRGLFLGAAGGTRSPLLAALPLCWSVTTAQVAAQLRLHHKEFAEHLSTPRRALKIASNMSKLICALLLSTAAALQPTQCFQCPATEIDSIHPCTPDAVISAAVATIGARWANVPAPTTRAARINF